MMLIPLQSPRESPTAPLRIIHPLQYFGPIRAIGKVCSAAQLIQAQGSDSRNYIRIRIAEKDRVAEAGLTPANTSVTAFQLLHFGRRVFVSLNTILPGWLVQSPHKSF
jgi:hypothetical protein